MITEGPTGGKYQGKDSKSGVLIGKAKLFNAICAASPGQGRTFS